MTTTETDIDALVVEACGEERSRYCRASLMGRRLPDHVWRAANRLAAELRSLQGRTGLTQKQVGTLAGLHEKAVGRAQVFGRLPLEQMKRLVAVLKEHSERNPA